MEMDQEELDINEELHERCGEIFLSVKGNLIFICTICELQTKDFDSYTDHISSVHYTIEDVNADEEDWYEENEVEEIEMLQIETKPEEEIIDAENYETIETLVESDVETKASRMDDFVCLHEETGTEENMPLDAKVEIKSEISDEMIKTKPTKRREQVRKTDNSADEVQMVKRKKLPPDAAERKHKCPICGFGFRDYSNLKSHIRRHSADKKEHACPHCPKRFFSSTELTSHVRRHTKERPYLCTLCGQTFVTNSTLTSHTKRHLNIRNSVCTICNKSFYDNTLLKEHMITHNGQRSFQCTVCDAKFARRKALVCHSKLHENKREYECDLCPASFNQGPGLYSHLRSKHQLDKSTISNYRAIGIVKARKE